MNLMATVNTQDSLIIYKEHILVGVDRSKTPLYYIDLLRLMILLLGGPAGRRTDTKGYH